MSIHQESLEFSGRIQSDEEAPDSEYSAIRNDSLAMFGAAIGGAVLGMLLTLLILAIINGGTLNFSEGKAQIEAFDANLQRVDANVGAVSSNIDTVAEHVQAIERDLATVQSSLEAEIAAQGLEIAGINEAITTLDQTRQSFDIFMGAMSEAISTIEETTGGPQ